MTAGRIKIGSLVLAICLGLGWSAATAQEKFNISIALSSGSIPAGAARIAQEMGILAKHGLNANLVMMDNGAMATTAVISGSVNFSMSGMAEIVVATSRGQPMVALNSVYGNFAAVLVLSKAVADKLNVSKDAPVRERLKALDGLVMASASAVGSAGFGLRNAADSVGAKLRMTYMAQQAMPAALETGAIHGFVASSPYYAPSIVKGVGVLWVNGPQGEFPVESTPGNQSGVYTTRGFAEANPKLMKQMIAAFDEFLTATRERPMDVKAAIAKLYPDLDAPVLDLIFQIEIAGFQAAKPLSEKAVLQEMAFAKGSGGNASIENLDPGSMIYRLK